MNNPINFNYLYDFELGKAEGAILERNRIISMLEAIDTYPPGWDYNDEIASIIAIIKEDANDTA